MPISLTKITNGQEQITTVMGLVQMVCRLHPADDDDDEEEEEEDDEEQDPMKLSKRQLEKLFHQSDLQESLPFAEDDATPMQVMFDYEIETRRPIQSAVDWEDQNNVFMNSMQTQIDTGKPSKRAWLLIVLVSLLNATIGAVHRGLSGGVVVGDIFGSGSIVLANMIVTFVCSFVCFHSLFDLTFTWYMVLQFVEQMSAVLVIESAMQAHLPAYCDL
jgi:hypothetical protein